MEKIGLKAVFETDEFDKGMKDYIAGIKKSETETQNLADDVVRLGGDFRNLTPQIEDMIGQLKASTPENLKFAAAFDKINDEFNEGIITSEEATQQLEELNSEIKNSKKSAQEAIPFVDAIKNKIEDMGRKFGLSTEQIKGFSAGIGRIAVAAAPFAIIGGSVLAVAKAFEALDKAVQPTVTRAEQVRDLARAMGTTAEKASMLIEAADDMGVEFSSLETAVVGMVRKGIEPSIEKIAELSDTYLALEPGLERDTLLIENFGRSGNDLAALLSKGSSEIRRMGQEAEKMGTVLDRKAVYQTRQYEIAIDNAKDSTMSIVQDIHMALIPALTKAADAWSNTVSSIRKYHEAQLELLNEGLMPATSAGYAYTGMLEELDNRQKMTDFTEYENQLQAVTTYTELGYDSNEEYVRSLWDIGDAAAENSSRLGMISDSFGDLSKEMLYNKIAAGLDADAALDLARDMGLLDEETYATLSALQELREEYDSNHDGAISAAEGAMEYADKAQHLNDVVIEQTIPTLTELGEDLTLTGDDAAYAAMLTGGLVEQLRAIPTSVYSRIVTEFIEIHKGKWEGMSTEALGQLLNYQAITGIGSFTSNTVLPQAMGGAVDAGSPLKVGDMGRSEIFVPATNGYIYPSADSFEGGIASAVASAMRGVMAQISTKNYNFNIGAQSPGDFARQFYEIDRLLS